MKAKFVFENIFEPKSEDEIKNLIEQYIQETGDLEKYFSEIKKGIILDKDSNLEIVRRINDFSSSSRLELKTPLLPTSNLTIYTHKNEAVIYAKTYRYGDDRGKISIWTSDLNRSLHALKRILHDKEAVDQINRTNSKINDKKSR